MRIIIDTIAELDELATVWARGRLAESLDRQAARHMREQLDVEALVDRRGADTRPVTAEGAVIPDDTGHPPEPASADAGGAPAAAPAPEPAPKRKRRTKAEMAADEAAAKDQTESAALESETVGPLGEQGESAEPAQQTPLDNLKSDPGAAGLDPAIIALAATLDGNDRMAHMNEGRDFISKHGFPKYNETFALVDVPPNIAGHTPEQAALHRAAMQWLGAQGGAA